MGNAKPFLSVLWVKKVHPTEPYKPLSFPKDSRFFFSASAHVANSVTEPENSSEWSYVLSPAKCVKWL